jgi:H+-translocating NAD(P) transhydrogenase subunit alpha
VVITTAAVPGKKAPVLITEEMVKRDGAGVGDCGPGRGARRQLRMTEAGEVVKHGVTLGRSEPAVDGAIPREPDVREEHRDVPAAHCEGGTIDYETEDEILRETLLTRGGAVVHPRE